MRFSKTARRIMALGAFNALLVVVLGAYAYHGLKPQLSELGRWEGFELAMQYHWYHALALIALGLWQGICQDERKLVALLFLLGMLLFSGVIYLRGFVPAAEAIAFLTPMGGSSLMAAWGLWGWRLWRG
uniref:DUF423 domain-containing protein n=1 Tax=Magnetococcus massalia (strain MO-1) TaxID=451514 RepID=A0A1S7LE54_MAGMO|nr:Conserved membrane protein of unknown function [Candidatus Magnetococcus massalia]